MDYNLDTEYVSEYDERYTVRTEVLVDEDPSTFATPFVYNTWPTNETLMRDLFDFYEGIGLTPHTIHLIPTNEW